MSLSVAAPTSRVWLAIAIERCSESLIAESWSSIRFCSCSRLSSSEGGFHEVEGPTAEEPP